MDHPDPRDPLDHLLLLWLRLPCSEWMSDLPRWDPSGCGNGKRNLPLKSRPTRRTGFVWMTCDTEDPPLLPVMPIAAIRQRRDVWKTSAGRMSLAAQRSHDGRRNLLVIPPTTTIHLMLLITPQATHRARTIFHRCSRATAPCLELCTRSLNLGLSLRRSVHRALSMLLLLA
jgi:hypothetical protein